MPCPSCSVPLIDARADPRETFGDYFLDDDTDAYCCHCGARVPELDRQILCVRPLLRESMAFDTWCSRRR